MKRRHFMQAAIGLPMFGAVCKAMVAQAGDADLDVQPESDVCYTCTATCGEPDCWIVTQMRNRKCSDRELRQIIGRLRRQMAKR